MGVVKSDKISQLTGTTSYLPVLASSLTSSIDGTTFTSVTSDFSICHRAIKKPPTKDFCLLSRTNKTFIRGATLIHGMTRALARYQHISGL